jgi:hypothetical protein
MRGRLSENLPVAYVDMYGYRFYRYLCYTKMMEGWDELLYGKSFAPRRKDWTIPAAWSLIEAASVKNTNSTFEGISDRAFSILKSQSAARFKTLRCAELRSCSSDVNDNMLSPEDDTDDDDLDRLGRIDSGRSRGVVMSSSLSSPVGDVDRWVLSKMLMASARPDDCGNLVCPILGDRAVHFEILLSAISKEDELGFGESIKDFNDRGSLAVAGGFHKTSEQRASTVILQLERSVVFHVDARVDWPWVNTSSGTGE